MIDAPALMTADELLHCAVPVGRTELVRGRLVVREPPGSAHGSVQIELAVALSMHLRSNDPNAGRVLGGDPGFWIQRAPDTVRAPDVAFVSRERLAGQPLPDGFLACAPDLAIEIRSPTDRSGDVLQKVGQWLAAGCVLVWVIDPRRRSAQHYAADGTVLLLSDDDALDAAPVLPGLRIPLTSLWQGLAPFDTPIDAPT